MTGRPVLYTPALLGSALFYGLRDPAALVIAPGPVIAYNGVHLLVIVALGLVAGWFASLAARRPHLWYLLLCLFLFILFHLFGALLVVTEPIRRALPAWTMFGATFAASITIAAFLLWIHPSLRRELLSHDYPE